MSYNSPVVEDSVKVIQYASIIDIENLRKGLERIKSGVAPGIDGELKSNFPDKKLRDLHVELKTQKYKPSPTKVVEIPKPGGGKRPLGIASQKDKVVQAALLNLLEEKVDPIFLDCSYGFRPGINCHNALKEVKSTWQSITWVIKIDIRKDFDNTNHTKMVELCYRHVDQPTLELIRKLLKAHYVEYFASSEPKENLIGTPQGSLISPILSNIYLHELDVFINTKLLSEWNRGNERKFVSGYQSRKDITAEERKVLVQLEHLPGLEEAVSRIKHNEWVKQGYPARDPNDSNFRRLRYARYADDFILGFTGTMEEAKVIKNAVVQFLKEVLHLEINSEKSFIRHSSERGIRFLGAYMRFLPPLSRRQGRQKKGEKNKNQAGDPIEQLKATAINQVQFRAPIDVLMTKAEDRGYAVRCKDGISTRATSRRKLLKLEDAQIVKHFSSIIRGILNYYSFVNSRSDLWSVVSLYRKSCALTLADKHKLKTAASVFKRYGPRLTVRNPLKPKEETKLDYPESLKTKLTFKLGHSTMHVAITEPTDIQGS